MSIDQLKSLASLKLGFARSNQFLVELPSDFSGGGGILGGLANFLGGSNLNLLCSRASLPGKQILTTEREIGMTREKIAYGYASEDVSMTFYAMNDYGIMKYFDQWRARTVNEETHEAKYKKDYVRPIKIHQLRKPILNKGVSAGPIRVNIGLGQGTVYSVELIDAFPTTVSSIELNNELDGLVEINVQISYTNWRTRSDSQGFISANVGLGNLFG